VAYSQKYKLPPPVPNEIHADRESFVEARIGVVDLGSTSFHAVVSTVSFEAGSLEHGSLGNGASSIDGTTRRMLDKRASKPNFWPTHYRFSKVARSRHAVTLGAQVAAHGHVSVECNQRAVMAAKALGKFLVNQDAEQVVAVATAALRQAENGEQVVAKLETALGYPIEILSGWAEATYVFLGQQAGLSHTHENTHENTHAAAIHTNLAYGPHLRLACMDLGGGSLEIAWGRASAKRPQLAISLPLGVGHFVHLLDAQGRLRSQAREEISQRVSNALARHDRQPRHDLALVSGGSARTLARIFTRGRLGPNVHGVVIPVQRLAELSDLLATTTCEQRSVMPGMPKKRVLTAGVGAAILHYTAEMLEVNSLITSVWGMREGLAISAARKLLEEEHTH
jgi:exopolyphosphatase/guanosine-5'-triphosphate,3'-diphosphate pyrophosphatase